MIFQKCGGQEYEIVWIGAGNAAGGGQRKGCEGNLEGMDVVYKRIRGYISMGFVFLHSFGF